MAIALHHSRAKGSAKLVLLGIANHDGDGGSWPSLTTLAKYAGVGKRQVQKLVDQLEDLGEIQPEIGKGGTLRTADYARPNLYHFLLECPATCRGDKNHTSVDGPVNRGGRPRKAVDNSSETPVSARTPGVLQDTGGVSARTPPPGVLQDTRTVLREPSLNLEGEGFVTTSPEDPVDNFAPLRPLPRADRCSDHQADAIPPPCGRCKDARLTLDLVEKDAMLHPPRQCEEHGYLASGCPYCPDGRLRALEVGA